MSGLATIGDHRMATAEGKIQRLEARLRRLADKADKRQKTIVVSGVGGVGAGPPSGRPDATQGHPMFYIEFNVDRGKYYVMHTTQTNTGFVWKSMTSGDL